MEIRRNPYEDISIIGDQNNKDQIDQTANILRAANEIANQN